MRFDPHPSITCIDSVSQSFKGTDVTFEQFPDRLRHVVQESLAALDSGEKVFVESKVFPVFETKGELVRSSSLLRWISIDGQDSKQRQTDSWNGSRGKPSRLNLRRKAVQKSCSVDTAWAGS